MQHSGLNTETSYFVDENDQRHSKNVLKVAVERGGQKAAIFDRQLQTPLKITKKQCLEPQ